jgi:hypothetical protein
MTESGSTKQTSKQWLRQCHWHCDGCCACRYYGIPYVFWETIFITEADGSIRQAATDSMNVLTIALKSGESLPDGLARHFDCECWSHFMFSTNTGLQSQATSTSNALT